jgi:Tol biopolymer transport system component
VQLSYGNSDQYPDVSPDGKWVVYDTRTDEKQRLMKISVDGGEPARLSDQQGRCPVISPDGEWIVYQFRDETSNTWLTGVIPSDGGEAVYAFEGQEYPIGWWQDGKAVCFTRKEMEG